MEDKNSTGISVFHQICEVNELDPQVIMQEAQKRCPERLTAGKEAEAYIWTAFEHRANDLLKNADATLAAPTDATSANLAYRIDADPAAPSFVVNEDYIRSTYNEKQALNIINALEHVRLPVTG